MTAEEVIEAIEEQVARVGCCPSHEIVDAIADVISDWKRSRRPARDVAALLTDPLERG